MIPTQSFADPHLYTAFPQKPLQVTRAQGSRLYTTDGARYIDLGGASHGVANFGHCHPRIVEAIRRQSEQALHLVGTIPSTARCSFLERLHQLLPPHLSRSFLSNSGTEAVEAALKFAHAATGRRRIVAFRNAFHGRTLGALSATHRPAYRKPFETLLQPVDFVSLNDEAALEAAVTEETSAVLIEPVQGEGGVHVADDRFLQTAQRIAHARGALLIVDEVQTGLGRTGRDLAVDGTGVRPDVLLLGKSLAGGLPIGVTAMTDDVAHAMPKAGHGNTFGGAPIVCAAATAALEVLRDERLAARAASEGDYFLTQLRNLSSPILRGARGRGLMLGLDLRIPAAPVLAHLLEQRYLALPAGSTVTRFLPPLTIPREELDGALEALEAALRAAPTLASREEP